MTSENLLSRNEVETKAAETIQRTWRRHIDIQVYKYYRDLINFSSRGNPGDMLRCINPKEAKLLDAAAGVTVKFRLAGDRFPPNIYYKIFTNRPIQDLCANSPKDYTNVTSKQLPVKIFHGRSLVHNNLQDDKRGWYKRIENNGWRLVSDRLIHHVSSDPVSWDTSKKMYSFNHNKLQRKKDVERRKKQKKVEWMQKMYKEGMLKAKTQDAQMVELVEGTIVGMMAAVKNQGPQILEDWEVDELLDWTTGLNFDEWSSSYLDGRTDSGSSSTMKTYRDKWIDLATSAPSQQRTEDRLKLSRNSSDPYELTLSTGVSATTANYSTASSKLSV